MCAHNAPEVKNKSFLALEKCKDIHKARIALGTPYVDSLEALCTGGWVRAANPPLAGLPASNRAFAMPNFSEPTLVSDRVLDREAMRSLSCAPPNELHFEGCRFDGADLGGLDLRGAQFIGCSFAETCLEKTILSSSRWKDCHAREAQFCMADATDARFWQCDLNNSVWTHARLASTLFSEVKLTGADFRDVLALGLSFSDTLLVGADLRGLSFRKQKIERLDMSDADLGGCDFREAVFLSSSLRDANLKNARFDGADLRSADLGGIRLTTVVQSLRGAVISAEQAGALVQELGLRVH